MSVEVVVCSVGNAPEFAPAERETELEVSRCARVEAELVLIVIAKTEIFFLNSEAQEPITAETTPVVEPFEVGAGFAEEFEFHLFELSYAEDEVPGSDFVTERFTDLCNAERHSVTGGALNVFEVNKNTLCGFGTEIYGAGSIFGNALEGLKHKVELTYTGEVGFTAYGAFDLVFDDELFHLFVSPSCDVDVKTVFSCVSFDKIVCAMT